MERERLPERGARIGAAIRGRFCELANRHPAIGDVRGLGAMMALELVRDRSIQDLAPDPDLARRIQAEALRRGLVLLTAGTYGNVIRVLVPLTVEDAALAEGLDVIEAAFDVAAV
jgi:4-aminobutyrate aminotransferase-like enzyme